MTFFEMNLQVGCCPAAGLPGSEPAQERWASLWAHHASRPAWYHICQQREAKSHENKIEWSKKAGASTFFKVTSNSNYEKVGVSWTVLMRRAAPGTEAMDWNKSERKRVVSPQHQEETIKRNIYISGDTVSGALILKPSFSRLQNSSSICTPGYGDAPGGDINSKRQLQENKALCVWIKMKVFF